MLPFSSKITIPGILGIERRRATLPCFFSSNSICILRYQLIICAWEGWGEVVDGRYIWAQNEVQIGSQREKVIK